MVSWLLPFGAELIQSKHVPWASATFNGMRHQFQFGVRTGYAQGRLQDALTSLAEHQFNLRDHIVADVATGPRVHDGAPTFTIEALTVEAA